MRASRRRTSALGRRYGRALLDVARDRGTEDVVAEEIEALAEVFRQDPVLRRTLTDPLVRQARREEVLEVLLAAAEPREELAELLRQMLQHDRMDQVTTVANAYRQLLDRERGIVEVDVWTATEMSAAQRDTLRVGLERRTDKKIRLAENVDPSLLGGVVARIGDVVYDASVQGQLAQIRREMAGD